MVCSHTMQQFTRNLLFICIYLNQIKTTAAYSSMHVDFMCCEITHYTSFLFTHVKPLLGCIIETRAFIKVFCIFEVVCRMCS